ncbi:MAG: DUF3604 domain-containing protein [Deltaproteobacteria bacterium]|nr:DUF3604 domain-containing protein [Deltaproteobacteria bacterium]
MKKWIVWGLGMTVLLGIGVGGYKYYKINKRIQESRLTPELLQKLKKASAAQNEGAIKMPKQRRRTIQKPNPLKNAYFGDTHVHTSLSFDSYLAGNRLGLEEAYRFAQGEKFENVAGEVMQLTEPLDFVAMTDHAESFGLFEGCADENITDEQREFCSKFDTPSIPFFMELRKSALNRPLKRPPTLCCEDGRFCFEHGKSTWARIQKAADKYNQPGVFTTFNAYEYSPLLPKSGNFHRNVIFRNQTVPESAVSAFDARTTLDLWRSLEETCTGDCEFLTIPHNMNKMWGLGYARETIDGDPYTEADWALRRRSEPLAEIYQVKGASECALGVGAVDEECAFEQFLQPCEDGELAQCASSGSFAREGLKFGLTLEKELGFNPLRFGFIGSTDYHNGNSGDTEEWDYRGKSGFKDSPAQKRRAGKKIGVRLPMTHSPGGLAAIWAVENTRDALFDGMKNRETFATSGTRIRLRFFSGWDFNEAMLGGKDMIAAAYEKGVPMGGVLRPNPYGGNPKFLVWAAKGPDTANLQRIQMVKGWIEDGETKEEVFDIACSDDLTPDAATGRCPDNGAWVDVETCEISADKGDTELMVLWEDVNFNPRLASFYYVRVLENPTCRWSTYDAIRLGLPPRDDFPSTIRERAWSSPIWFEPGAEPS